MSSSGTQNRGTTFRILSGRPREPCSTPGKIPTKIVSPVVV
jgi:hypothetical protein